ncbi:MAG: hypothetical protein JW714_01115 [Candidatus Omnitrophica bacterium]|nr:hypothetical protein [Candidatus Omnitrophota bacterium]
MRSRKGELVIEYCVLIAIAILALLAMRVYMTRAVCGRWRQAADVFGGGRQFER